MPRAGLEPTRPKRSQDFKSCASANSATPAKKKSIVKRTPPGNIRQLRTRWRSLSRFPRRDHPDTNKYIIIHLVPKKTPQEKLIEITKNCRRRTFLAINFGCRVNAAETNQLSQLLINQGFKPTDKNPGIIIVNTCAITKKGEKESLQKIRSLKRLWPKSTVITTGCADLSSFSNEKDIFVLKNKDKQKILEESKGEYSSKIKDKFSASKKFILKIQSGCSHYCTYCIVPYRRTKLWSLSIKDALATVKNTVKNGYTELILTGVNLDLYRPGLDKLLKNLLEKTDIPLISLGSVSINSITPGFLKLHQKYPQRLKKFIHVPLQSGSDKILKLMNRPYTKKKIEKTLKKCLGVLELKLGTDIIVGFPGEDNKDFQDTVDLLKKFPFQKIHTFRFSPRPDTTAEKLLKKYPPLSPKKKKERSKIIRNLHHG